LELERSHVRVASLLADAPQHPVAALSDAILLADREAGPTMAVQSSLTKDSTA
jgi:hypothetical protein